MYIDNSEKSAIDFPYPNGTAYQEDLYNELYSEDSERGKLFRASVNQNLSESPCIMLGPNDERIRQEWLCRDGVL